MRAVIVVAILVGFALLAMAAVTAVRRRRRSVDDIRGELDATTRAWLAAREARSRSARLRAVRTQMVSTLNLERPPSNARRALFAFDYESAARNKQGCLVGVPARGGPVEFTAMTDLPAAFVRRREPGFEPIDRQLCPPGWAITVAPGEPLMVADNPVLAVLASITPFEHGGPADTAVPTAVRDAVATCWGRIRVHFCSQRIFVAVDDSHLRSEAVLIADHLGDHLPLRYDAR